MVTPLQLALSIIFGVLQIVVGSAIQVHGWHNRLFGRLRFFLVGLAGIWFICSGVDELVVSSLDALNWNQHLFNGQQVQALHTEAQTGLWMATVVLVFGGIAAYPLVARRRAAER